MEHVEYVYTFGMTDAELGEYLRENEVGVLSLADDGDAYAIPVGYHYDGESLVVRLGEREDSTKMEYLETTETVTLVVYEKESERSSWSIIVRGKLHEYSETSDGRSETSDERSKTSDTEINERFEPLRLFGESVEEVAAELYELEIEEVTGRRTD